jgi:hypothetical protein
MISCEIDLRALRRPERSYYHEYLDDMICTIGLVSKEILRYLNLTYLFLTGTFRPCILSLKTCNDVENKPEIRIVSY